MIMRVAPTDIHPAQALAGSHQLMVFCK